MASTKPIVMWDITEIDSFIAEPRRGPKPNLERVHAAGLRMVGDAIHLSAIELLSIGGIGESTVADLMATVGRHGYGTLNNPVTKWREDARRVLTLQINCLKGMNIYRRLVLEGGIEAQLNKEATRSDRWQKASSYPGHPSFSGVRRAESIYALLSETQRKCFRESQLKAWKMMTGNGSKKS